MRSWQKNRALVGGLGLALLAAMAVGLATPAAAAVATPPATSGSVVYSAPQTTVTCLGSAATGATFHFSYNATHLHTGYNVTVAAILVDAAGAPQGSALGTQTVTIVAGQSNTVQVQFPITGPTDPTFRVSASARYPTSQYRFVAANAATTCPSTDMTPLIAPRVSLSKVDCHHHATVTFDGASSNQTFTWVIFPTTGGSEVNVGEAVAPGHIVHHAETNARAGEIIEVRFGTSLGGIDVGKYTFPSGCSDTVSNISVTQGNKYRGGKSVLGGVAYKVAVTVAKNPSGRIVNVRGTASITKRTKVKTVQVDRVTLGTSTAAVETNPTPENSGTAPSASSGTNWHPVAAGTCRGYRVRANFSIRWSDGALSHFSILTAMPRVCG
jgi:hypothetical protein